MASAVHEQFVRNRGKRYVKLEAFWKLSPGYIPYTKYFTHEKLIAICRKYLFQIKERGKAKHEKSGRSKKDAGAH